MPDSEPAPQVQERGGHQPDWYVTPTAKLHSGHCFIWGFSVEELYFLFDLEEVIKLQRFLTVSIPSLIVSDWILELIVV